MIGPEDGIACRDCGLAQHVPVVASGSRAECRRCGRTLARPGLGGVDASLAFAAAALLLWFPACLASLLEVSSAGAIRQSALASGVGALWAGGFPFLAVVVAAFSVIVPTVYLVVTIVVLLGVRGGGAERRPPSSRLLGRLFRWSQALRTWTMTEVFLLGACVAFTRIGQVAQVSVGAGGWCLIGATLCLLLLDAELDERTVWRALPLGADSGPAPSGISTDSIACDACDLLHAEAHDRERCSRCGARLVVRKPGAIDRTWAFVICGFLLYIPANLLPVLSLERFGREQPNTILGGVQELAHLGLWPLALIVLTASVLIPLAKLSALTCNLVLTQRRSPRLLRARTRLHRAVDAIGRWSNIDVFMVSILVALIQFGALMHVRAEDGMVAFAAVVITTMIAAKSFDSRLMWDAVGENA